MRIIHFALSLATLFFFAFFLSGSSRNTQILAATSAQCNIGSKTCKGAGGNSGNTGWQCVCNSSRQWVCNTWNPNACPIGSDVGTGSNTPVSCTAIDGKTYGKGQGVCTTLNGSNNGNYCECIDAGGAGAAKGDTGTWRCAINGTKCPIQVSDTRVVTGNSITNCNSSSGVTISNGCASAPTGSRISYFSCPNDTSSNMSSRGCEENGVVVSGNSACFNTSCGTQQIDIRTPSGTTCFYSTAIPCSTPTPSKPPVTKTPTPTPPTTTTKTPTPSVPTVTPPPPLVCKAERAYRGDVDITQNLNDIKFGETITFKGFAANTSPVKSMTFQVKLNRKVIKTEVVESKLVGSNWISSYDYTFNKYGNHVVKVISINK